MKKRILLFTLAFCIVLCLSLFVSCGKDKTDATTAEETAAHEHVWDTGVTTANGPCESTTVYTCAECGETKTETVESHVWGETARLIAPPTADGDGECERLCSVCKKTGGIVPMTNEEYNAKVEELKAKIDAFSTAAFGGARVTKTLSEFNAAAQALASADGKTFTPYAAPKKNPIAGHPRVLFNESDLDAIRGVLKEERSRDAAAIFFDSVTTIPTGELGEATLHEKGTYKYVTDSVYNYDDEMLKQIQALALDYRLTGNKISGYGAILAIENYILTLDIARLTSDPERQYGAVMYTAACVYDWCYDLTSNLDRLRIVSGVEHKIVNGKHMEMGFPPIKQYSIAGHGCEYQLMRDYLAFALAIYDEYPGWWEFIAGRFYQEYVEARNEFYAGGMVSQGVSLYVRVRFASDLYSAWLLKAGVGEMPYNADDMKRVMRSIYSYELPNGNGFAMGDSHETKIDGDFINYGLPAMMAAYLFNDETMRAQLESREGCYTKFYDEDQDCFEYTGVAEYLICSSNDVKAADDVHKDMDLILYNGGWLGQIIARNNWGEDQATVLMKIGVKTAGNHDHQDQGQFQIFYKGMLAGDTGVYDSYSTDHERYYHRQTIAHNCILVRDPSVTSISESGGQKRIGGDEMSLSGWNSESRTKTGEVIGVKYAYADAAKTKPLYAYIAGDISLSYYSSKATSAVRRMLAVYDTKNDDVPLCFFVFDNVTAATAAYEKVFLLHTRTEPTIAGKTVTEVNGEGKLVLQNVFGGDTVTKIGGEGNNYNINGTQVEAKTDATSREDGYWGRVEIVTSGEKTQQMLNVIYVCDADKDPALTAAAIETADVKGAVIGKVAAVFVTSDARRETTFKFTAPGEGDLTYYVSGVKAGTWTLSVNGQYRNLKVTEESGFLTFTAPAGVEISLIPS
ncbi:MAG: heparinase II/III family protein [Clostridia bacterium]|nr:heparinase II/III family protein [Clostridia bacterium]